MFSHSTLDLFLSTFKSVRLSVKMSSNEFTDSESKIIQWLSKIILFYLISIAILFNIAKCLFFAKSQKTTVPIIWLKCCFQADISLKQHRRSIFSIYLLPFQEGSRLYDVIPTKSWNLYLFIIYYILVFVTIGPKSIKFEKKYYKYMHLKHGLSLIFFSSAAYSGWASLQ